MSGSPVKLTFSGVNCAGLIEAPEDLFALGGSEGRFPALIAPASLKLAQEAHDRRVRPVFRR